MIEDYLKPVSHRLRGNSIVAQVKYLQGEVKEVNKALSDFITCDCGHDAMARNKARSDLLMELGDVIICSVGGIDQLGATLESVLRDVYVKNNARHYYDEEVKNV